MYILILLIVTILVFKSLFNTFGFTTTQDINKKEQAIEKFFNKIAEDQNVNLKQIDNSNKTNNEDIIFFNNIYNKYKGKTQQIKQNDITSHINNIFIEEKFLKSSEKVVVTILNSFSENKLDVLEGLLTKKMFNIFKENILNNLKKNIFCKTVIVSIDDKKIIDKQTDTYPNKISLLLTTKQINYIENSSSEIISGSKSKINEIKETWHFVKENGNSEYWLLDSIE